MRLSHRALWNTLELVQNVKDSVKYIDEEYKRRKLLNYLMRMFEVFEKFVDVYIQYKYPNDLNHFATDSVSEILKVCDCLKDIMKMVKVRVSVIFRKNAKANHIIKSICFKAIAKFQKYLIQIDFFNKEMFRRSALNME